MAFKRRENASLWARCCKWGHYVWFSSKVVLLVTIPDAWQALEALRKLKSEKTAEAREFKLRLEHLKTHKDTAGRLRADVDAGNRRVAEITEQSTQLQQRIQARLTAFQRENLSEVPNTSDVEALHAWFRVPENPSPWKPQI